MLLVYVEMRIESCLTRDGTVISVLTDDNYAAGVAREAHRLDRGVRRARGFNRYICSAPTGSFKNPFQSFALVVLFKVKHVGRACSGRHLKTMIRRADAKHFQRAAHHGQNDCVDADRPGTEHQHSIANRNVAAFDCVKRCRQSTPPAMKVSPSAARLMQSVPGFK